MESRYALRAIEGAIGYDCRRLDDGRKAEFRHTLMHRRARFDFMERRDVSMVLATSYVAMACMSTNPRVGIESAKEVVKGARAAMVDSLFPYMDMSAQAKRESYEDYSEYFDELDAIEAANAAAAADDLGGEESEMV